MGNNKYTDEFRRETADYVISTGRPITEVAKELGLNDKTVNDWMLKRKRSQGSAPGPKAEDRELREAKKRIRELEMENEFLKKQRSSSPKSKGCRQVPPDAGEKGRIPG